MTLREQYYTMAKACAHIAEKLRDPEERVVMLEIAQRYVQLANHISARVECGTAANDQDQEVRNKDR
jgi:hypothetical protein